MHVGWPFMNTEMLRRSDRCTRQMPLSCLKVAHQYRAARLSSSSGLTCLRNDFAIRSWKSSICAKKAIWPIRPAVGHYWSRRKAADYESCVVDWVSASKKKHKPKRRKMTRRDIYQRKAYGMHRMSLAVARLNRATSHVERERASHWIDLWSTVSRVPQFKLGNGGGSSKKKNSLI